MDQVVLGTNGKIAFAAGNGVLDSTGIGISSPNSEQDYAGYRFSTVQPSSVVCFNTMAPLVYLRICLYSRGSRFLEVPQSIAQVTIASHSNNSGSPSSGALRAYWDKGTTAPYVFRDKRHRNVRCVNWGRCNHPVTDSTSGAINLYGQVGGVQPHQRRNHCLVRNTQWQALTTLRRRIWRRMNKMQQRVRQAMLTHATYVANLKLGENEDLGKRRRSFAVEAPRSPDYIGQSMTMGVVTQLEDTGKEITDDAILGAITNLGTHSRGVVRHDDTRELARYAK